MRLTPMDINNRKFGKSLRGYDTEEVESFLQTVSEDLEELISENVELKKQIERLNDSLTDLKEREHILKDTMLLAQQTKEEIKTNAIKEAEIIIRESELQSEKIIAEAKKKAEEIQEEINSLVEIRTQLIARIESAVTYTENFLESLKSED
jgi:cell division initiation protein